MWLQQRGIQTGQQGAGWSKYASCMICLGAHIQPGAPEVSGTHAVPVGVHIDDRHHLCEGWTCAEHVLHIMCCVTCMHVRLHALKRHKVCLHLDALAGLANSRVHNHLGTRREVQLRLALVHAASVQGLHHLSGADVPEYGWASAHAVQHLSVLQVCTARPAVHSAAAVVAEGQWPGQQLAQYGPVCSGLPL